MGVTTFFLLSVLLCCSAANAEARSKLALHVDISHPGRLIPSTLFGIFFEEINHAGTGGLWAELVNNRGFEAGGPNTPSNIDPWYPIGNESQVRLSTERFSCFLRNPVALKMEVLCEECPHGGVGVANPGFWGMNIIAGAQYLVTFWLQSTKSVSLSVSFVSGDGLWRLAQEEIFIDESSSQEWSKQTLVVEANLTDHYGRLVLTSSKKGVIWLDQISVMPVDTYKGHGFRKELALMLEDLNPKFIRFPGGCYVEGVRLANAWKWRDSVGPWEERPGHFGDVWNYWSDDGLGFYELLQLAEDLGASPVWVFNNGISHTDEVSPSLIGPFVQDILDGIEFAKGPTDTKWGALRASMGHPDPFKLNYIAIGNEDCGKKYYRDNYMKFYKSIKSSYPEIKLISNCDGSSKQLDHPADLYDFHIYTSASTLFSMAHQFDYISRDGPKAFVSEYAVTGADAGQGSLLAALAEGAFLIGLELNSDIVEMASYAPLFVNKNDRRWTPDSIVFDSWQQYGTPSYWVQHFFKHSSGAKILSFSVEAFDGTAPTVVMSAVQASENLIVKAVNFGSHDVLLEIVIRGLSHMVDTSSSTITVLASSNVMDENSFASPNKVVPQIKSLNVFKQDIASIVFPNIEVNLPSNSFVAVTIKLNLFSMSE